MKYPWKVFALTEYEYLGIPCDLKNKLYTHEKIWQISLFLILILSLLR